VKTWWSSFTLTQRQFFNLFGMYGLFSHKVDPEYFTRKDYDELLFYLKKVNKSKTDIVVYPKIVVSGLKLKA